VDAIISAIMEPPTNYYIVTYSPLVLTKAGREASATIRWIHLVMAQSGASRTWKQFPSIGLPCRQLARRLGDGSTSFWGRDRNGEWDNGQLIIPETPIAWPGVCGALLNDLSCTVLGLLEVGGGLSNRIQRSMWRLAV